MKDNSGHKRDRSPKAEAFRTLRNIVKDFTGWNGLMRSLVQYQPPILFEKKPKRGWAAQRRAAPFADYLPADKMEVARRRHKWRQKELEASA